MTEAETRKRLIRLRDRLTDLTRRNRSLRLLRLYSKWSFDLENLNKFGPKNPEEIVGQIIRRKSVAIARHGTPDHIEQGASHRLRTLQRNLDQIEEERGMYSLYVGYPFLCGKLLDGTYLQAPILLFPVKLAVQSVVGKGEPSWMLDPRDEESTINRTLVLAIERYNEIQMDDGIFAEASDYPTEGLSNWVSDLLANYGLIASRERCDAIEPLPEYRSDEIPNYPPGVLFIRSNAVLGSFPQSSNAILGDYERMLSTESLELGLGGKLLGYLGGELQETDTSPSEIAIDNVDERDSLFITEVDNSQTEAIVASQQSESIVIHGPPGTGKSQVIVNLVANALQKSETLLVVCQKRAALDVVFERLVDYQLGDHLAVVHDALGDRRELYNKIDRLLSQRIVDDALVKRWDHNAISDDVQYRMEKLRGIGQALVDRSRYDVMPRDLYARIDPDADLIDVSFFAPKVCFDDLTSIAGELKSLGDLFEKFERPGHPLSNRRSFGELSILDQRELTDHLKNLQEALNSFETGILEYLPMGWTPRFCCDCLDEISLLAELPEKPIVTRETMSKILKLGSWDLPKCVRSCTDALTELEDLVSRRSYDINPLTRLVDISLQEELRILTTYLDTTFWNGVFNHKCRKTRSKARWVLRMRDLPPNRTAATDLVRAINESLVVERINRCLSKDALDVFALPRGSALYQKDLMPLSVSLTYLNAISNLGSETTDVVRQTQSLLDPSSDSWSSARRELKAAKDCPNSLKKLRHTILSLRTWFSDDYVRDLENRMGEGDRISVEINAISDSVAKEFDHVKKTDSLKSAISCDSIRSEILSRLVAKIPPGSTSQLGVRWRRVLEQSVYIFWLDKIESQVPELEGVSNGSFDQLQAEYAKLLREKRDHSEETLRSVLRRRIKEAQGHPKKGQLQFQVERQRGLYTIRRLVKEFGDALLFDVVPCWLVTPEMVSSCFPDEEGMFDIVIFDEASQCPVENAFPSVHRAKKIVVAGDEKQLPPNRLFTVAADGLADENTEESNILDQSESLLDLAKQCYPTYMLTWHYRSAYEELINYSNYAFYKGRIHVAPNTESPADPPPIEWIRVKGGLWQDQKNLPEAEAVCEYLRELLASEDVLHRGKTVGVITFNQQQQSLILDCVDDLVQNNLEFGTVFREIMKRPLNRRFFVKNIENVQGDERDIVVFSTSYGRGLDGRIRLQFGTLNLIGGQNRLNVAITRAREKVVIFSSIEPDELDVSTAKNEGPRYLKWYLQYAKAVGDVRTGDSKQILEELNGGPLIRMPGGSVLDFDSDFEEQVHEALENEGLVVDTQVGASGYRIDLAIRHPLHRDRYVLGVECDGASFHSARSVRERDVYRQAFLESRGWKIARIWSRNWWRNSKQQVVRIVDIVNELV